MPRFRPALQLSALLASLGLAAPSPAQTARTPIDVDALGPQVGDRVPAFRLSDQHGTVWTLDSLMGPKGLMLLFHRSADW